MRQAFTEAERAAAQGEVPVGALLVRDGRVIGRGYNAIEQLQDPTAHAEMRAIRQGAAHTGSRRLLESTLYVTLEPCAMCAGAIVLARVSRLVFGAFDPKSGACGSLRNLVDDGRLNHRCQLLGGVLEEECAGLLRRFFAALRADRS
jgi:tRNA(adenine34) deaminase